jgi:gluconate 2-dehydrogenase gamma chain
MDRRFFILASIGAGTALALLPQNSKTHINIVPFKVIEAVQETLFPKKLKAPSASEFGATNYLLLISSHSSFVKSDLRFLKHGADLLINYENNFLTMNPKERDNALRDFSNSSSKAENWLSLLLFYTLEALLSDPIYGGNRNKLGWRWLNHNTGQPRPEVKFAKVK